jgi:hypothetical protein
VAAPVAGYLDFAMIVLCNQPDSSVETAIPMDRPFDPPGYPHGGINNKTKLFAEHEKTLPITTAIQTSRPNGLR